MLFIHKTSSTPTSTSQHSLLYYLIYDDKNTQWVGAEGKRSLNVLIQTCMSASECHIYTGRISYKHPKHNVYALCVFSCFSYMFSFFSVVSICVLHQVLFQLPFNVHSLNSMGHIKMRETCLCAVRTRQRRGIENSSHCCFSTKAPVEGSWRLPLSSSWPSSMSMAIPWFRWNS